MSRLKTAPYRNSLLLKGSNIPLNCTLLQSSFAIFGTHLLLYVTFPPVCSSKLLYCKYCKLLNLKLEL